MSARGGVERALPAGAAGLAPGSWTERHGLPVGAALLAAGGPAVDPGRFEALLLDPVEVLADPARPFDALEALAGRARGGATAGPCPRVVCLLGYDLGRTVEDIPAHARVEGHLPDCWAARYTAAWIHDRATGRGWISADDAGAADRLAARLAAGGPTPPAL
ncbi:MAG: hypothetical protein R3F43_13860, partial [bacterium]